MRHPPEGVLRRLLDEPAGVADSDREHVAGCPQCLDGLAAMQEDAALVRHALATDVDANVDAAWQRLQTAAPAARVAPPRARRLRAVLRRPGAVAVAVAVAFAGAGTAAASGWLEIFRTEQIVPISLSAADLVSVPDLSEYGELSVTNQVEPRSVADAAAAAAVTSLDVPEVATLPRGVSGEPVYRVGGELSATFTFSEDRAAEAAAEAGETLPPPPPGLDGSRVRMDAGPGVAQTWSSASSGVPALVVVRAVAPSAFSSGVPLDTVREYLLSLPGLPDDVADQLRAFTADGSTLPLPVPGDQVATSSAQVNGEPATVLETRDRTLAAIVWVDDGVATVVGGALTADEVQSIARELR
jgi:hypothetical protein